MSLRVHFEMFGDEHLSRELLRFSDKAGDLSPAFDAMPTTSSTASSEVSSTVKGRVPAQLGHRSHRRPSRAKPL